MFHRGPSRIIWFIIGGVTTAWWLKGKDARCHHRYPAHVENGVDTYNRRLLDNARNQEPNRDMWEDERTKMRELARQANDAMSDMSETALDNILVNVQSFKNKLAEKRIARERSIQEEVHREQKERPDHRS